MSQKTVINVPISYVNKQKNRRHRYFWWHKINDKKVVDKYIIGGSAAKTSYPEVSSNPFSGWVHLPPGGVRFLPPVENRMQTFIDLSTVVSSNRRTVLRTALGVRLRLVSRTTQSHISPLLTSWGKILSISLIFPPTNLLLFLV